jgi:type I restriction enzyme S subunit
VGKVRLGDVLTFQRGYDLTHKQMNGGHVPVVGSSEIIGWHDVAKVKAPALLVGRSGTVGRPQFYDMDIWAHNTTLFVSDFHGNNPKFCYYFLENLNLENYANASGVPTLNRNFIHPLTVDFPKLPVQKRISKALSLLDQKIELNNKINSELEAVARKLYEYWFVQFEFPDEFGRPYKTNSGEMEWSEELKRNIPQNWEAKKLKDLFEFEKGTEVGAKAYSEIQHKDFIKFYRVADIDGDSQTFINSAISALNLAKASDIVVTFDGSVGKIGLGLNGAISSGLRKVYDKSCKIDNSVIWQIFLDPRIKATIEQYATGSILLHASRAIDYLSIPYDENIILKFQDLIKPIFAQYVANKQESAELAQLRDFLLPMLMNGQISVK